MVTLRLSWDWAFSWPLETGWSPWWSHWKMRFSSPSDIFVAFLCSKLIFFSIFHKFLTPAWHRMFQQDGTGITNRLIITSLPLLVSISEVVLPPFWLNFSLGTHDQVVIQQDPKSPPVSLCSSNVPSSFVHSLFQDIQYYFWPYQSVGFCVQLTEHSKALYACPLDLICDTSLSVTDLDYHHLCMLYKISTNLSQEWAAGSFEIKPKITHCRWKKNQSVHGVAWRMFTFSFSAEVKPNNILLVVSVHWLVILCSLYDFVRQEPRLNGVLKCKARFFPLHFNSFRFWRTELVGFLANKDRLEKAAFKSSLRSSLSTEDLYL